MLSYSHGVLMVFSSCSSAPNCVRREIDRRWRGAAVVTIMRFLRRHQYLLCFLGVLVFSCVMVLRQFMANQSAQVELREGPLLLHERGEAKACDALYQQWWVRSLTKEASQDYERAFAKALDTVASEQSLVKLNPLSPSPKSRQD